jgi:hypothetical protein
MRNLLEQAQGKAADAVRQSMAEVEDRIAALVPRSPAGAALQVWLLRHVYSAFEWREPHDEIASKLICSVQQIGEARP